MGKYELLILEWCKNNSVTVPTGFGRNTPGNFAVVKEAADGRKLVATTWSKIKDVLYYVENLLLTTEPKCGFEVLDFKKGLILKYSAVGKFVPVREMNIAEY